MSDMIYEVYDDYWKLKTFTKNLKGFVHIFNIANTIKR